MRLPVDRLEKIEKELAELTEKRDSLKAKWQQEKDLIEQINRLKEQRDALRVEEQNAERRGDLEKWLRFAMAA